MIDKIDRKLLFELTWNCRQTNAALGKKLRISKQVANYRTKRLEEKGIITHYTTLIDWRKLGYNAIRAYIKWRNIDPETEQKIYKEVERDPFFMWTVKLEGEFDFATYMWVENIPEFSKKWFGFLGKYRKHILKEEIYESVNMIHYPFKIMANMEISDEKRIGGGVKQDHNEKDYEILSFLATNAKATIVEIAEKVKLTSKSVISRMRKLEEKGIILGYFASFNQQLLNYDFYKIDFYVNDMSRIKEMFEFAKNHKKIWALMRTIGGPDFEIEVMVRNTTELKNLIKEIRTKFSDVIEHYRFHRFERTLKQVYLPGQ